MGKRESNRWWSSMLPAAGRSEPDTDYADMGTAFGLDASLCPGSDEPGATDDGDESTPEAHGRRD